jgi:hypothetical protein
MTSLIRLCALAGDGITAVAAAVAATDEATRTLALGVGHVDPLDIAYATDVDRFDFAMEVTRDADGLRLDRVDA